MWGSSLRARPLDQVGAAAVTIPASPHGLTRKSVGSSGLSILGVSASAPMTVLAGGVIATFATAGVLGVPLAFVLLTIPLLLVSVGLVAMSRDMAHAGAFYAFLARGLGRTCGLAGAAVALVAYNAIQISLYGLFGATVAGIIGGTWWVWAIAVWIIVTLLGLRHIELNTRVVGIVLSVELVVIALFIAASVTHPAGSGDSMAAFRPSALFANGIGVVLALTVAAFIGFETVIVYREEAREWRAVRRAAVGTVLFLGAFYTLASWSLTVVVGPSKIIDAARDPASGLPFSILEAHYGPIMSGLGQAVLITSIFAAMVSFHHVVARYVYGLSREGILPARWGMTGGSIGGVPIGGSIVQSVTAAVTIAIAIALDADPVTAVFTLLSEAAAIGVLLLMVGASLSVILFYRRTAPPARPETWRWLIAPAVGGVTLAVILAITVLNITAVTGATSYVQWLLPGVILAAAVTGAVWAQVLRRQRPGVYTAIGYGMPKPLAVLDRSLSHLEL
jgi:amino acid transporter